MSLSVNTSTLRVVARASLLSQKQVTEVHTALLPFYPDLEFLTLFLESYGDKDLKTPLRDASPDFFTREIDAALLEDKADIAIHSAKDLPDALVDELEIIALTSGIDPSDSLVFRDGENLMTLFSGASIGISCLRREEAILKLNPSFVCKEIRGTIQRRLEQLYSRDYDAVVIAEAALIRLELTHLSRIKLDAKTHPMQGRLAIVAKKGNEPLKRLFSVLDARS